VAEELGLDQFRRNRTAVHSDEGPFLAWGCAVNGARHQLLAGTAFALDQDRNGSRIATRRACSITRFITALRWMMLSNTASSAAAPIAKRGKALV
jgi:hypothetical protein